MADSQHVAVELPEHQYLNETNEKSLNVSTTDQTQTPPTTDHTDLIGTLIALIIVAVIPILQIYIGRRYTDNCPLDWHIPFYLVVAGVVGITVILLGIIQAVLKAKVFLNRAREKSNVSLTVSVVCVACLATILFLFLFIWFVFGCYWVFRSWNIVQYVDANRNDYCHRILYRFAFWLLLGAFFSQILACGYSYLKVHFGLMKLRDAKTPRHTTKS
ncbi:unnamed protein product [Rotaria sp. Silwood2]|nr:unnamed protein product [Rotaria sp. Silwood2]CAF2743306.1 unnamed protein product [Rotaria sp. Silwood2]CAF2885749.1 unnamed protein product [Rotaria sp. Silwood2]CAF4054042.1 unnamed protein product [Rotaria sp. Silwood2]CAF4074087.1 unnamed protein product [Rotaria sp. Silwood2]